LKSIDYKISWLWVSDNRQAIESRMGADDRSGDAPKAFGQLAGPNDRVGPPALARRRIFQVRGTTTVGRYTITPVDIKCSIYVRLEQSFLFLSHIFLLYRCVKSWRCPKTDSTSSVWRPTRRTSQNFTCTRGLCTCSKVAI